MKRISVALALLALGFAVLAFVACSSSGSSGGGNGNGYSVFNCPGLPQFKSVSSACVSCMNTSCSSEITSANSACSAEFACICPAGLDASSCASSLSDAAIGACSTSLGLGSITLQSDGGLAGNLGLLGCALANCATPCSATTDGG